jgi:hypothetical protein
MIIENCGVQLFGFEIFPSFQPKWMILCVCVWILLSSAKQVASGCQSEVRQFSPILPSYFVTSFGTQLKRDIVTRLQPRTASSSEPSIW